MINIINTGLLNSVIVILFLSSIAAISIIYIIPKQKQKPNRTNVPSKNVTEDFTNMTVTHPQITVIIADSKDDENLISEIADMYINERTFFYTGKTTSNLNQRPEKEIYIKYESVSWNLLKRIKI